MSVSGNATIARKKTLRCKLTLCNRLAHSTQLTHRRDLIRTHVSAALRKRSVGSHISKATPSLNKATGAADGRLRFRETRPEVPQIDRRSRPVSRSQHRATICQSTQQAVQQGIQRAVQQGKQRAVQQGIQRAVQQGIQQGHRRGFDLSEWITQAVY